MNVTIAAKIAQLPAIDRISFRLFYTVAKLIPLKSLSQLSLSVYLAANHDIASS